MHRKTLLIVFVALLAVMGVTGVFAAASGSFVFDYAGDPGDNDDGPQFDITLVSPTDDGVGCDWVIMLMVDANGVVVDVDANCVFGTALSDDGDYSVIFAPTARPITYALFDVTGAQQTYLSGLSEGSPAYVAYLLANGVLLDEDYEDLSANLAGLPSLSPYTFGGGSVNGTCQLNPPVGSVVGEMPSGAQAYYSPGNITNIFINPGTYIVVGQDASETYYKIVLACQYLWVRKDTMQPSFQAPQNGAPLPTTIVS